MRRVTRAALLVAAVASMGLSVRAADIAQLEWGAFVIVDDSSNGWSNTRSVSSDDGRSVTLSFSSLEAKADGETAQATAKLSGRYEVFQPTHGKVSSFRVDVEGHVIKSEKAVTRVSVKVGGATQDIEWPAGETASEKFKRSLVFSVPQGEGQPTPLDVAIVTEANKNGQEGAAYVSVSSITVTAEDTKVAAQ